MTIGDLECNCKITFEDFSMLDMNKNLQARIAHKKSCKISSANH
jgi:hypothetical protein